MKLEIIYEDELLIAINKPHGLLVHRTALAYDVYEFALQILRDQIGQHVYPCHRIDRKTSGVLLFTKDENTNKVLQQKFAVNEVKKKYLAIVRGFSPDEGIIDYPLKREDGTIQEAITHYTTINQTEINVPFGNHPTSRYSLVLIEPQSGRMHQIRKHLAHIIHPIIGDRPYGCNKQNKLFKDKWNMNSMMLHALNLKFDHPVKNESIQIVAKPSNEFLRTLEFLEFDPENPFDSSY